ncbi:MAG: metalloregulator ArsR/SmtB family transcription factor [Acidimicrobiales bacterium]|nr:metalloregulator ArsR/SmtB family transcription factor [Acidimicrobiales bacterium]
MPILNSDGETATPPLADADLESPADAHLAAKLFRGFADPMRLAILNQLDDGELRVTDLVQRLDGSQGNISGHLQCLKGCGLVADRPEGRQVFYRIARPEVVAVLRAGSELLACSGVQISLCPNYRNRR